MREFDNNDHDGGDVDGGDCDGDKRGSYADTSRSASCSAATAVQTT